MASSRGSTLTRRRPSGPLALSLALAASSCAVAGAGPGGTPGTASGTPPLTDAACQRHITPRLIEFARDMARLRSDVPDRDDRLIAWARMRLGTPYVLDPQGEGQGFDPDPLFTPDKVDCTVLVLQAAASLDARTPEDLVRGMMLANYRRWAPDGSVAYEDRFHYSEDRISASPLFEDITAKVFPSSSLVTLRMDLNRKSDGTLAMPIGWTRRVQLVYRPTQDLAQRDVAHFPRTCGVIFVKRANFQMGMVAGHEGIVVDGRLLFHASSVARKVVCEPFVKYARTRDGLIVYRFIQAHERNSF